MWACATSSSVVNLRNVFMYGCSSVTSFNSFWYKKIKKCLWLQRKEQTPSLAVWWSNILRKLGTTFVACNSGVRDAKSTREVNQRFSAKAYEARTCLKIVKRLITFACFWLVSTGVPDAIWLWHLFDIYLTVLSSDKTNCLAGDPFSNSRLLQSISCLVKPTSCGLNSNNSGKYTGFTAFTFWSPIFREISPCWNLWTFCAQQISR